MAGRYIESPREDGGRGGRGWLVGGSISGVRDILAIKPVNIFYTGGVRLQRCTKDGYGLSIFLKYHRRMYNLARPRLNARGGEGVKIGICGNYSLPDFCVTPLRNSTEFLWLLIIRYV